MSCWKIDSEGRKYFDNEEFEKILLGLKNAVEKGNREYPTFFGDPPTPNPVDNTDNVA